MTPLNIPTGVTLGSDQEEYWPLDVIPVETDIGPGLSSLWKPTEEELNLLNNGGVVELTVLGLKHPPVIVEVASMVAYDA